MTESAVADWVREDIRALAAYQVPDADGLIKLDAMENPYALPAELISGWLKALSGAAINRYPDPEAAQLKQQLRVSLSVPQHASLMLGNGSDELIQLIAMTLAAPGRVLMAPEPGFAMYALIAKAVAMDYVGVPLKANDFSLDLPAMLAAIEQQQPAILFLANPNNPTGNLFAEDDLRQLLEAAPGVVVIDEAYYHFTGGVTALPWLEQYPNLLVLRTLSKIGLAGLRLGLLCGSSEWLSQINKLRLPYNINCLTQISVTYVLKHGEILEQQAASLCRSRSELQQALMALPGVQVWPSASNFLLLRVTDAPAVHAGLKSRGILIKNLHGAHPLLQHCLRVTVSTPAENHQFLAALSEVLDDPD